MQAHAAAEGHRLCCLCNTCDTLRAGEQTDVNQTTGLTLPVSTSYIQPEMMMLSATCATPVSPWGSQLKEQAGMQTVQDCVGAPGMAFDCRR